MLDTFPLSLRGGDGEGGAMRRKEDTCPLEGVPGGRATGRSPLPARKRPGWPRSQGGAGGDGEGHTSHGYRTQSAEGVRPYPYAYPLDATPELERIRPRSQPQPPNPAQKKTAGAAAPAVLSMSQMMRQVYMHASWAFISSLSPSSAPAPERQLSGLAMLYPGKFMR